MRHDQAVDVLPVDVGENCFTPCTLIILDVNNDLKNDLIAAGSDPGSDDHNFISVLLNTSP